MLDWWQWLLFPNETLIKYGYSPVTRKYWVGHSSPLAPAYGLTIGHWGCSSKAHLGAIMGKPAVQISRAETDYGVFASWDSLRGKIQTEYNVDYGYGTPYPHLALMEGVFAAETERMRTDPRSVPLAAYQEDGYRSRADRIAKKRKRKRYGIFPVEVVRYYQTMVQIMREFRVNFGMWRSWDVEQKQAAWVQGNYWIGLPPEGVAWVAAHGGPRYLEPRAPGVHSDPTRSYAPAAEVALADLRGPGGATRRRGKAPRTLQR